MKFAAQIEICGKHWIWILTLIKEFFPQWKPNKCGDEPELTDGVFWHQMLCQMVSPSSLSSSTLLRLLHSWVLPGRVQTCSSSLHPSAARLIGFSSSVSSRRDALLWWSEVSETAAEVLTERFSHSDSPACCLCCEGVTRSLPLACLGVLLHLVTGGLLPPITSVFLLSHTHSLVFDLVVCVRVLGEGWGVTLTSPPPSQVLQAWTADLITARWGQSVSSLSACPDLSEPAQPPSSLRGANAFRASTLSRVTVQGRIYKGCVHTDDAQTRLFKLKVQKYRTRTTTNPIFSTKD